MAAPESSHPLGALVAPPADLRHVVSTSPIVVVFVSVYAVALLTTLVPAVRASRIYPAQALRYE